MHGEICGCLWVHESQFQEVQIQQISREEDGWVDELAWLASSLTEWTTQDFLYLESTTSLVIQSGEALVEEREEVTPDWKTRLEAYLRDRIIPANPKIAFPLIRRVQHFVILEGVIFKKSYGRPLLWCLGTKEVEGVLREVHKGCCDNHLGGQALAKKVILVGYFWPTLTQDTIRLVKVCQAC